MSEDADRGRPRLHAQITVYSDAPLDYDATVEQISEALRAAGVDDWTGSFAELTYQDEPDGEAV